MIMCLILINLLIFLILFIGPIILNVIIELVIYFLNILNILLFHNILLVSDNFLTRIRISLIIGLLSFVRICVVMGGSVNILCI